MPKKFKPAFGVLARIENDSKKREEAIKNDIPVRFQIEKKPNQDFGSKLIDSIRTFGSWGKSAVQKHNEQILKHS